MTKHQAASDVDQRFLGRKRHSSYTEKGAVGNKTECVYDVTFLFVIRFKYSFGNVISSFIGIRVRFCEIIN